MPIIVGGVAVDLLSPANTSLVKPTTTEEVINQKDEPAINIVVEPTTEEQKTLKRKFVVERKKLKGVASNDTSLVVNGKKKSIGRKSHYLLDMLTLDSE